MAAINHALQGLASAETQFNTAASRIAQWPQSALALNTPTAPRDTVDLSAQAVAMLQAQNNFEANTKLIKITDQMDQTLLNSVG